MRGIQHHILHAEDNPDDAFLVELAFRRMGTPHTFAPVANGAGAIAYLKGEDIYADRKAYPLPTIVLLDIKMPCYSGLEVLEWIRGNSGHRTVPVVILTSSRNLDDIRRAYELGVNAFLVKPVEHKEFQETLRSFAAFWLDKNILPM